MTEIAPNTLPRAPRGLGKAGKSLWIEFAGRARQTGTSTLLKACQTADVVERVRLELSDPATTGARRDQLTVEYRLTTTLLDRLLLKVRGRAPGGGGPVGALSKGEAFEVAKSAHAAGVVWRPDEWAHHSGHVPPSAMAFVPDRLRAAAECPGPPECSVFPPAEWSEEMFWSPPCPAGPCARTYQHVHAGRAFEGGKAHVGRDPS